MKTIIVMAIMLLVSMTAVSAELIVSSVSIDGDDVLLSDGTTVYAEESLVVEKGEEFEVKVRVYANTSAENIIVSAEILGYEFSNYDNSLEDQSSTFDLQAGDSKFIKLTLTIPDNVDRDQYDLRIRVASRKDPTEEYLIGLRLDGERHSVVIRDIQVADSVIAGRSIIGNVRVKNIGQRVEESVKVTLSIPELGISDSEYIDDLNDDDSTTSEDLLLRIPACADEGTYDVVAEVRYHDNYKITTKTTEINVVKSDLCEATSPTTPVVEGVTKTVITVPTGQEVRAGQSVIYPVVISNLGNSAKTYVLTVSPSVEAFGTYRIDPSNVMVISGQSTQTAYVYLTVDENAQSGLRDFKITVTADGEAKDATLTASIVSGEETKTSDMSDSLKTGLQISLLVLVILLLILLVIFGFNKMKASKDDGEDEEEVGQTYY
jgi:uncharacterized membrane protein